MKRGGRLKRSWIKRGKKWLERKTPLRARGGSSFPGQRQPEFMAWMLAKAKEEPRPCDGCKRWRWTVRCHLDAKGRGAPDLSNTVLMCDGPGDTCHRIQEKDTARFCERLGVDLWARAAEYAREYADCP